MNEEIKQMTKLEKFLSDKHVLDRFKENLKKYPLSNSIMCFEAYNEKYGNDINSIDFFINWREALEIHDWNVFAFEYRKLFNEVSVVDIEKKKNQIILTNKK